MVVAETSKAGVVIKMEKLIEIKSMSKIYSMGDSDVYALDSVSLDIYKNDFVSIIGPSGSGKSTLMNMIGLLDVPTNGDYFLDRENVKDANDNHLAEIRNRKIGFIFQGFNLLQKLTAVENVELPLIYAGVHKKERREKAIEALEKVGLSDRLHHKPVELSGGQQQRVAIARALATSPSIILADEPTGALDTHSGSEIMNILRELNEKDGVTVIIITHDISIAQKTNRMIRITDGKVSE